MDFRVLYIFPLLRLLGHVGHPKAHESDPRYQQSDVEMVGGVADVEKVIILVISSHKPGDHQVELKLKEINRNYLEKSKLYDKYYEQYQNAAQDILTKRQVDVFD